MNLTREKQSNMIRDFQETKGHKEMWAEVNKVLNPKPMKEEQIKIKLDKNSEPIHDEKQLANEFNKFFVKKVEGLLEGIDKEMYEDPIVRLKQKLQGKKLSFSLHEVKEKDIEKVIKKLKKKQSCGKDEISSEVLKLAGNAVIAPLTKIINLSITSNKFPKEWKEALIKPLFKNKGSKLEMQFYRPVSLLPVPGMILERIVAIQVEEYFKREGLFGGFQYGFRAKRSTITAVAAAMNEVLTGKTSGKCSGALLFDLSAAFDTVDPETLCRKLKVYGFTDGAVQ